MQNAANQPIVGHVEAGRDVLIEGQAASARLDGIEAQLDDRFHVVRITAPPGGLSLSGLIAQLSGREKFDDQDDGALETGFRRLLGVDAPGRVIVLLLDATEGVQRAVLRYLQQVGRNAPALRYVIASCPELTAFLEAPDMARLRERLATVVPAVWSAPVIVPASAPGRALMVVPPGGSVVPFVPAADAWAIESRRRAARRKHRRSRRLALMWTTSGLAMVASVALGAWLGQAKMAPTGRLVAAATVPTPTPILAPVPAHVVVPPLAARVSPAPATVPTQAGGAPAAAPALAKLTEPEAVALGEPPAADPATPDPVIFAAMEDRLTTALGHPRAGEPHRAARPRYAARSRSPMMARTEPPRLAEGQQPIPDYGAEELPPEEPVPIPRRGRARGVRDTTNAEFDPSSQSPDPSDGSYIGTSSTGPYGARLFRYGP
jgi:hypothetical protein